MCSQWPSPVSSAASAMTQRPKILREALATASRWPHFARKLLSSQVPKPSQCLVPGTSGLSYEAQESLRICSTGGSDPCAPSISLLWCSTSSRPASCPSPPESHQLPIFFHLDLLYPVGSRWESTWSPEGSTGPYPQDGDPEAVSGGVSRHHVWLASSADVQWPGNITSCL